MELKNCPLCHNHCPADNPSCGKGKKYFASENKHGHKGDKKDNHKHDNKKHHGKEKDDLLGALDEQQKAELKEILKVLVKSWKDE